MMKQHIIEEQLNEFTDEQKDKLQEWWKPGHGDFYIEPCTECSWHRGKEEWHLRMMGEWTNEGEGAEPSDRALPLLSIGQCFELITNKTGSHYKYTCTPKGAEVCIWTWSKHPFCIKKEDLIDALFEVVKAVL